MAATDWTQVTAITRSKILPGIEDQIKKDMPIFRRLFGKATRLDGGHRIEKVVRYANSTQGGWFSGLDTLDTAQEQTRTRAYWAWRQAHQPIVFSNIDLAKNGGAEKVFDLMKTESADMLEALKDKFGTALYTKQAGDQMDSLVDGCDDQTNVATYGGISRSTHSWWRGDYTASASALALSTMAASYDAAKSGNDVPTIIVTHESEWTSYEALLEPNVRIQLTQNDYRNVDGGFRAMYFRGTPVIADEYCTDGYMYFLNEKYWEVPTLKHPKHPTDKMGFTTTSLREPTDQDGQIGFILWFGDLICTQPRRQAVDRGIT